MFSGQQYQARNSQSAAAAAASAGLDLNVIKVQFSVGTTILQKRHQHQQKNEIRPPKRIKNQFKKGLKMTSKSDIDRDTAAKYVRNI